MVGEFSDVIRTIDAMKAEGVISEYAIGGAMAFAFWNEPIYTEDLDVVVTVGGDAHPLDPLRPVFDWLARRAIALDGEHAMIAGVPVQFLPAWHPLIEEAVQNAATVPYDAANEGSISLRVITAAYLVAGWKLDPSANTLRRTERAARLFEAGATTSEEVEALLQRYRDA